jgi:hypothetical protein
LYNERPTWLVLAHEKLDAAVAAAYRFLSGLKDEDLLARLLELNLARPAVRDGKPAAAVEDVDRRQWCEDRTLGRQSPQLQGDLVRGEPVEGLLSPPARQVEP